MLRPATNEYHEYFDAYIELFQADDLLAEFAAQPRKLEELLGELSHEEASQLHTPYTWNLKQVVGHLLDTERIFSNRLLRIAAGDPTPNLGFEQNDYVDNFDYSAVAMKDLLEEFAALRLSNLKLVSRCSEEQLSRQAMASGKSLSARAAFFILGGHVVHHLEIMKQRLSG